MSGRPARRRGKKRPKGPQRLGTVRWEAYDHRRLWNMIMDARPEQVFDRYDRWTKLGESLLTVNRTVQAELNTLFRTWQGTAALSAGLSNTRLLQWSQDTAESTQRIGEELGRYGNALVEARKRMPQPRHVSVENEFRAGDGATVWRGPENAFTLLQLLSDHRATTRERAEAKERAVEVMRTFETDAVRVERRLDTYSQSPNVVRPGGGGDWTPPVGGRGGEDGIDVPPADWPASTVAASATGGGPTAGGYGPGGYGGTGYGPGGSGPGAGGYGAGGYGAGQHGPGQSFGVARGPGGLPGGAAGEPAAARTTAAGARGGGAGMMYPPMAGAGMRDDEHEKRVAPYLVDDDDLFDDERTVAPPVFGA